MNRDQITAWAWEADKFANKSAAPSGSDWWQLERDTHLAALVAAAEREACAKVCDDIRHPWGYSAETADWERGTDQCAAAIRARGQTP